MKRKMLSGTVTYFSLTALLKKNGGQKILYFSTGKYSFMALLCYSLELMNGLRFQFTFLHPLRILSVGGLFH